MLRNLVLASVLVAAASLGGAVGQRGSASAQPTGAVEDCPDQLVDGVPVLVCACGPSSTDRGSIWGTDVYTADSAICHAAFHAGVIGSSGGVVEVREARGRDHYAATTRNGATSFSYGSYPRSITFRGAGDGVATIEDCPDHIGDRTSLTCHCPSDATASGSVWGDGVYTADSAICRAAVHAGVIDRAGGTVSLHTAPGRGRYPAATRHGVDSSSWDSYPTSIVFNDRPDDPK